MNGPPTQVAVFTNGSNASGFAEIHDLQNDSNVMYRLEVYVNRSGPVTHVGPVLDLFPAQVISNGLSGSDIRVEPSITVNLTVFNESGGGVTTLIPYSYDVINGDNGDHLTFSDSTSVENLLHLPLNNSYAFNLFPESTAPLHVAYASGSNPTGACDLNLATATIGSTKQCTLNGTVILRQVHGYINSSSLGSFSEFSVVPFSMDFGGRVFEDASFLNIGGFFGGANDTVTAATGFFNITVPAVEVGFETLLLFLATNASTNYGAIANITLDFTSSDVVLDVDNLTLVPMYGAAGNFTTSIFPDGTLVSNTSVTTFNITQPGNSDGPSGLFTEIEVAYPNGLEILWTFSPEEGESSIIYLPILNGSTIDVDIFAGGSSPKRITAGPAKLAADSQFDIEMRNFERKDDDGNVDNSGLIVEMFDFYNATCNNPDPVDSCSLFSFNDLTDSNIGNDAFKLMLLGKANVRMTDSSSNVSITYIGVDLGSSNAPPADFNDDAATNDTDGGAFEEVWQFGSNGPEIYEYAFVTIPYDTSELNESVGINASIDALYDTTSSDTWTAEWNSSTNNITDLAALDHYSAEIVEWEYLVNGTECHNQTSETNVTNPCSFNASLDELFLRIPHFSGTGLAISGGEVSSPSSGGSSGSSGGGGGGSSGGGGVSTGSFWHGTFNIDNAEISDSDVIRQGLRVKQRVRFFFESAEHHLGVTELTETKATINVSSTPQSATLNVGESANFELDDDTYYDLKVTLDLIENEKANFSLVAIHERIPEPPSVDSDITSEAVADSPVDDSPQIPPPSDIELSGFLSVAILGVLIVIVGIIIFSFRKSFKSNKLK